jgi:inosose dehydratase
MGTDREVMPGLRFSNLTRHVRGKALFVFSQRGAIVLKPTRREWLATATSVAMAPGLTAGSASAIPLGFSLYGMKSLPLSDALKICKSCGYDGVELALMPGYSADPAVLTADRRKELRKLLADSGLTVHGLMENLPALGDDTMHKANLDRLKVAVELANTLVPDAPPPIETVLGAKPADWDKVKDKLAARLMDWAAVGKRGKTVIAVKPHVANALHTPEGAAWLLKQIDSDFLRLAFDYSHFELRGLKLGEVMETLLPHSVFVHVKDARGTAEKFEFLLPGEGNTDYREYARRLTTLKYRGPVVVEVSGMVSNKRGYDPEAAAKACFKSLSPFLGRSAG